MFSNVLSMFTDVVATMIGNVFANVLVLITIWVLVNLSVIFKNAYPEWLLDSDVLVLVPISYLYECIDHFQKWLYAIGNTMAIGFQCIGVCVCHNINQ